MPSATISQCVEQVQLYEQTEPFLGMIEEISTHRRNDQWMVELLLNGKPVQFKIDTGADVSAVSEEIFKDLDG